MRENESPSARVARLKASAGRKRIYPLRPSSRSRTRPDLLEHYQLRTLSEAEQISYAIANHFPDSDRVLLGLWELLLNAIEHGNLGISYEEKGQLLAQGKWYDEVQRRLTRAEHKNKWVQVTLTHTEHSICVAISDEGKGFDWQPYLAMDEARLRVKHGRGIAYANMISFDSLSYNEKGNEVTACVQLQALKATG